jgi:uncharacterized protein (DUF486 family)
MTEQKWFPLALLVFSNLFMTFAWYGHLKTHKNAPLWTAILASWGIAFFEYCLQVPGNRIGAQHFTVPQLKILQEIITMTVFAGFAVSYLKTPITKNYLYASLCLLLAAYFIFRDQPNS